MEEEEKIEEKADWNVGPTGERKEEMKEKKKWKKMK
jgi:hypothetical protein